MSDRLKLLSENIELLRELDRCMPIYRGALLLHLLLDATISRGHIAPRFAISQAALARNLQALAEGTRGSGKTGLGLISMNVSPGDRRVKEILVTTKGEEVKARIR